MRNQEQTANQQELDTKVLKEIRQVKNLLAELIGTSDEPAKQKFSKAAISKAAKEFRELEVQRGEWIQANDISKVIKSAPWNCTKIIIEHFEFTNYFMRGRSVYFNRKDLVELGIELKKRNINLKKYVELVEDKEKFQKYIDGIIKPDKKKARKQFRVPENLRDIFSTPYSAPTEQLVRDEIEELMGKYKKFDLSEYIDLYYDKTHALFKYDYSFDRYLKPELKKFCKDWTFKFNYANNALSRILELKHKGE